MYNYVVVFNLKTPDILVMDSDEREGDIIDLYDMHVHNLVRECHSLHHYSFNIYIYIYIYPQILIMLT